MSRRQEREEKRARQQQTDDVRWFISSPAGRRLLRGWMERARHGIPTFNGNSRDNFVLGMQALMAGIVAEIKAVSLSDFHTLELEAQADEKRAEQAQAQPDDEDPDA